MEWRNVNVDFGAYLYLLLVRWLSVTSAYKDTHNNEQWSLANASHQPHGMQSLRLEGHIFLPFVFIPHLLKTYHERALSCLHCLDWKAFFQQEVHSLPSLQNEAQPARRWVQSCTEVFKTIYCCHWSVRDRPAPVGKEQRYWWSQFIESTITEGQFIPGSLVPWDAPCPSYQHQLIAHCISSCFGRWGQRMHMLTQEIAH